MLVPIQILVRSVPCKRQKYECLYVLNGNCAKLKKKQTMSSDFILHTDMNELYHSICMYIIN